MRQGCKVINLGDSTAIMCGGEPTDHKCNTNSTVYGFSDGFQGSVFDKAKQEGLNLQMCDEDKLYFLAEKGVHQTSGSVACSICGRANIDNSYWL